MLDIKQIREDPERIKAACADKNEKSADIDAIVDLDARRRKLQNELDNLLAERKTVSKEVGMRRKAGDPSEDLEARSKEIGQGIGKHEADLREVTEQLNAKLLWVPNVPDDDVPRGKDESDNEILRTWGEPRELDFESRDHLALGEHLELFEAEGGRGVKVTGSNFVVFKGAGARLVRGLINFMLDVHTREHGYTEVAPPLIVNRATMTGTGQLPKLADDMYHLEKDDLFLIPTAEVPVTNLHRDELLDPGTLPLNYTAYTPCFRREAGAFGATTRGLQRVHQFDKVELVKIVEPQTSRDEHESLLANCEEILRRLDLAYRISLLSTGDLSFAAQRCYDLEAWAPSSKRWLEVSSVSNFGDFQARRARIRYRDDKHKARFAHTLNGSGLALPRVVLCLLETHQQPDGSVIVPDALRPYVGGREVIEPPTRR